MSGEKAFYQRTQYRARLFKSVARPVHQMDEGPSFSPSAKMKGRASTHFIYARSIAPDCSSPSPGPRTRWTKNPHFRHRRK